MNTLSNGFKQVDTTSTDSMNDMVNAFNNNAQLSNNFKDNTITIKQKNNNVLIYCNDGQYNSKVTIPHTLGYVPSIIACAQDSNNPHRMYPLPHMEYKLDAPSGYVGIQIVLDIYADINNVYINLQRSDNIVHDGSSTYWVNYWLW